MDSNQMKETEQKYSNIEKEILHVLNRQIFEEGIITEEVYLKAKARIEEL